MIRKLKTRFAPSSWPLRTVEFVLLCMQGWSKVYRHTRCLSNLPSNPWNKCSRRGISQSGDSVKPFYITTPIFYPNSGMSFHSQDDSLAETATSTAHWPSPFLVNIGHFSPLPAAIKSIPTCPILDRNRRARVENTTSRSFSRRITKSLL